MISYVAQHHVLPQHQRTLKLATKIVRAIPDDPGLGCFEVARVVARLLGVAWQDGKHHAWCLTADIPDDLAQVADGDALMHFLSCRDIAILDVYAYGRHPQVQLVYPGVMHPAWKELFLPETPRQRVNDALVERLTRELQPLTDRLQRLVP